MTDEQGDIQAAIEAGREAAFEVETGHVDLKVIVMPDGDGSAKVETVDLEAFGDAPRHKVASVVAREVESFIEYLRRNKGEGTLVFAGEDGTMAGILDYHEGSTGPAGWRKHRVDLSRPKTIAWNAWMKAAQSGGLTQVQLANFLEDRLPEIVEPDGADLLELAQEFRASKELRFRSQKKLSNGQTQVEYVEEIDGGGFSNGRQIAMPTTITIRVAPYRDSGELAVVVRLRWSLADQAVRFTLVMPDTLNDALDDLHDEAIAEVRAAGFAVIRGEAK